MRIVREQLKCKHRSIFFSKYYSFNDTEMLLFFLVIDIFTIIFILFSLKLVFINFLFSNDYLSIHYLDTYVVPTNHSFQID